MRATLLALCLLGCDDGQATIDALGFDAAPDDAAPDDAALADTGPIDGPVDATPAVDAADAAPSARWTVTEVGAVDAETLRTLVDPAVTIENGYAIYTLESEGGVRATVTMPDGAPPADGWHLVANAHGTTGADEPCALFGTDWAIGNAGLFGARGLIGVAPEYPGLVGPGVHPYLVADSEGPAILDAVALTLAWADATGVPTSGRVALVGFSQGGHAALAAAARHRAHAPQIDLRGVAVAAPATLWAEHWSAGLQADGPHLVYHALLTWSWARHYGIAAPLWAEGFDADAAFNGRCVFGPDGRDTLSPALPLAAVELFHPAWLDAWRALNWRPDHRAFEGAFAANRVVPFAQTAPIHVYQGTADVVVPAWQTEALVDSLRAAGMDIEYSVVEGGRHDDVAFGVLAFPQQRTEAALTWLRAALDDPR